MTPYKPGTPASPGGDADPGVFDMKRIVKNGRFYELKISENFRVKAKDRDQLLSLYALYLASVVPHRR